MNSIFKDSEGYPYRIMSAIDFSQMRNQLWKIRNSLSSFYKGGILHRHLVLIDDFLHTAGENTQAIFCYDGPWGVLSGSAGFCIVQNGIVVAAYATKQS